LWCAGVFVDNVLRFFSQSVGSLRFAHALQLLQPVTFFLLLYIWACLNDVLALPCSHALCRAALKIRASQ
jgi:hypothetical protein